MAYSKLILCLFFLPPLLTLQTIVAAEQEVPCFFIFGDSVVDVGNNNNRQTLAKSNFLPYGIDFPEGPTGRFSNGRTIVDVLAELLGFDKYIPPFANLTNHDILKGVNYASACAGILNETGRVAGDIISFDQQLSNHEVIISRIAELLGSESAAKEHLSTCLYYLELVNNDYLFWYYPQLYFSKPQYTPQQFAEILIAQYSKQLRSLYNNGARKVAVNEIHQLSTLPEVKAIFGSSKIGDNATQIFNEMLKLLINDLNSQLPDAKFLYTIDRTIASYGHFKVVDRSCCFTLLGSCVRGIVPCRNRDEYMFYDGFHSTDAASEIFGKIAYDSMSPLYDDPIDIW